MTSYTLSPQAAAALREIWEHIAEDSLDAADRVLERFAEAFERLAERPHVGHYREDLTGGKTLKLWSVHAYLIVYDPDTRPLEIGRIFHGSRDIASLLRKAERDPPDRE
ncbi:MAG: type II toxin-antitoxin system RelE/ParE family toxin [Candidatus Methylomirabilis sp.]|nr:type II toxin-antitoxin system RelE/ParE family toxin [Deltaproteobacteria bacterium]